MTESSVPIVPQYLVARLRRAFAEDPRICEMGVRVTVRGEWLHLSGEAPCEARRALLEAIVREHVSSASIRNDVHVVSAGTPTEYEDL